MPSMIERKPRAPVRRSIAFLAQLFGARRALSHLVEMYEKGQWRLYYKKEEAFAEAVRDARQAVEHWTEIVNKVGDGTQPAR